MPDSCLYKGTVENEQIQQVLCCCYDPSRVALLISIRILMYRRFPFSRQINANVKYVRVLDSAKAFNQRIINIVHMCSNSIKSGLSLYCDAWYINSTSNVRDEHVVHCCSCVKTTCRSIYNPHTGMCQSRFAEAIIVDIYLCGDTQHVFIKL